MKEVESNPECLERLCKLCKKLFVPKREWQKFCSSDCQKKYWRQVYSEKRFLNERLEEVEKKLGMKL